MRHVQRGFTLLELMITVSIVGILASIAIPSYQAYVYRAKAAEVVLVLDKLKTVLVGLEAETGKAITSGDLYVVTAKGKPTDPALEACSQPKGGPITCVPVASLSAGEFAFPKLGLTMSVTSGMFGSTGTGQYTVYIDWGGSGQALQGAAKQTALAVMHIMEPHARKVKEGSYSAHLYLSLH